MKGIHEEYNINLSKMNCSFSFMVYPCTSANTKKNLTVLSYWNTFHGFEFQSDTRFLLILLKVCHINSMFNLYNNLAHSKLFERYKNNVWTGFLTNWLQGWLFSYEIKIIRNLTTYFGHIFFSFSQLFAFTRAN